MMDAQSVINTLNRNPQYLNHLIKNKILIPDDDNMFLRADVLALIPEHKVAAKRQATNYSLQFNDSYFDDITTPDKAYLLAYFQIKGIISTEKDLLTLNFTTSDFHTYIYSVIVNALDIKDNTRNPRQLRFHNSIFINTILTTPIISLNPTLQPHALRAVVENLFNLRKITNELAHTTKSTTLPQIITILLYQAPLPINYALYRTTESTRIRFKLNPLIPNEQESTPLLNYIYPTSDSGVGGYIQNQAFGESIYFR